MRSFPAEDESTFESSGGRPALILCLEDNARDFELIRHALQADGIDCEVVNAKGRADFESALLDAEFDLIISDFSLPSFHGMAALAFAQIMRPDIPFLFVSGTIGAARAAKSRQCGAAEVIPKDQMLQRLAPVVRRVLQIGEHQAQSRRIERPLLETEALFRESTESAKHPPLGSLFDPTAREWAEEQLLLQSSALNAAANGIMITDRKGIILWANPALCRMTGYSACELLGQTPRLFKSDRHEPAFYREFWETILAGRIWKGRFINRRQDGSLYLGEQTATPVRHGQGEITHFISVTEDVTARVRLEEQLRHSQRMEAVGQLAAGVSHEFNNLLTVIRCNSELLVTRKDVLESPEARQLLLPVVTAADRAAELIRRLVAFCQKQSLQCQSLDLNDIVQAVAGQFRRNNGQTIQWECHPHPNLPPIRADANMIRQVIADLVANAIDAMPQGGRLVLATASRSVDRSDPHLPPEAEGGDFVCLTVSDSGRGISPANLPRIFEPFFSTKDVGKGTGLGLALAYGIVRQHGGWIDVTSEVDRGTTFNVLFPTAAQPADSTPDTPGKAEPQASFST